MVHLGISFIYLLKFINLINDIYGNLSKHIFSDFILYENLQNCISHFNFTAKQMQIWLALRL